MIHWLVVVYSFTDERIIYTYSKNVCDSLELNTFANTIIEYIAKRLRKIKDIKSMYDFK